MADSASATQYTKIYEGTDHRLGKIIVCIEGKHDLDDDTLVVLDHVFRAFQLVNETVHSIDDPEMEAWYISLAKSYFYVTTGTVVTSENQPTNEDIGDSSTWRLDVPEYGVVIIEPCGAVEYNDDTCQIFVSHPGQGVYLVILLEIIDTNPLTFRSVDLQDKELCDGIINGYLLEIGAVEVEKNASSADDN
ncbi:MAG: hypothetical protein AAB473_02560 [Patescibacteria group bacterium]